MADLTAAPAPFNLDDSDTAPYCDADMSSSEYRLAAVLFVDIVGFSRMLRDNEQSALGALQEYTGIVRDQAEKRNGRVIRIVGDGILCEFQNTTDALTGALQIQNALGAYNRANEAKIGARIGVHIGDIHFVNGDALGEGVSIAERIQSVAKPGRVCISQDVKSMVGGKVDVSMEPLGRIYVKSLGRSIEASEIAVSKAAEFSPAGWEPDPENVPSEPSPAEGHAGADTRANASANAPSAAQPTTSRYGQDEVKALVLEEIKKAGRRLSVDEVRRRIPAQSKEIDAALETLAERGFLTRVSRPGDGASYGPMHPSEEWSDRNDGERRTERGPDHHRPAVADVDWSDKWDEHSYGADDKKVQHAEGEWNRALAQPGPPAGTYDPLVEDYKDYAAHQAEKEKSGFRSHLISYLGVNAGLFFLWSMVSPGFPWFLFVLFGWGIGLASHFVGMRDKVRESQEIDGAEGLTREQLRVYRRLAKARSAWHGHLASNVATSVLLLTINLVTSPGFFWAVFPIGFMAISLLSHLPAFKSKENRLLNRLKELGAKIGGRFRRKGKRQEAEAAPREALTGASLEAEETRRRISHTLQSLPPNAPVGEDLVPELDNYVSQIKTLDQKNKELEQLIAEIPVSDLQRDLLKLQQERARAESDAVKEEYDRSISQIQKQQASYSELKNQNDILRLRLNSGMSQLRQMEIELARMRNISQTDELSSVSSLKEKTGELSRYLDDLEQGYKELE